MSNENLQKWALIAEIVGGIAIIFSLIFVGLEIRQTSEETAQNTLAIQASTRQEHTQQAISYISQPLDSLTLANAIVKSRAGEELSPLELQQLYIHQHMNFRVFESAYYQYSIGTLEEVEWQRITATIRSVLCNNRHAQDMWENTNFQQNFRSSVDELTQDCFRN